MKIAKEEAAAGIESKDNVYVSFDATLQQIESEEEERHPVGQKFGDEFIDGSTEGTITPNTEDLKVQLAAN